MGPHLDSCIQVLWQPQVHPESCDCAFKLEQRERQAASRRRWLGSGGHTRLVAIQRLVDTRQAARAARQYDEADTCSAQLRGMGVDLYDRADGTTVWRYGLIITGRTR